MRKLGTTFDTITVQSKEDGIRAWLTLLERARSVEGWSNHTVRFSDGAEIPVRMHSDEAWRLHRANHQWLADITVRQKRRDGIPLTEDEAYDLGQADLLQELEPFFQAFEAMDSDHTRKGGFFRETRGR